MDIEKIEPPKLVRQNAYDHTLVKCSDPECTVCDQLTKRDNMIISLKKQMDELKFMCNNFICIISELAKRPLNMENDKK